MHDMTLSVSADPYPVTVDPLRTAVIVIDMQRDFMEPNGFGAALGNDVTRLQAAIDPIAAILATARRAGLFVIHTREGHRPDLSDLPPGKKARGRLDPGIGDRGPMGRILVRGEPGHEIIPALAPIAGEPIIDKPGKGAFHATDLETILRQRAITTLILCGVTTEVCVHSTLREANDRGFECLVISDGTASYFPAFHEAALAMVSAQGGIFGFVTDSATLIRTLQKGTRT